MGFSEQTVAEAQKIIERYPQGRERSALLPLLHLVQAEEGQVSAEGVAFCARLLGLTQAQVSAVATFYTMFKRRPTGDYLVSVCTNAICNVMGGQQVYDMLAEYLGVGHEETTPDGKITFEHAECLAACDYAPVLTVNYEFFDRIDVERALAVVTALQRGEAPQPSRGARLCTLREMARQLAGVAEDSPEALAGGVAGAPTLRGTSLAAEHGITAPEMDPATPIGKGKAEPR